MSSEIKVEIITKRKILDVVPGYFRGSTDRIEVDVCVKCAAIVFDPIVHDKWHRSADPSSAREWRCPATGPHAPHDWRLTPEESMRCVGIQDQQNGRSEQ